VSVSKLSERVMLVACVVFSYIRHETLIAFGFEENWPEVVRLGLVRLD
jgi:hypothetical protein